MKTKTLPFLSLILILLASACSPLIITDATGEQPTPEEEVFPAPVLPETSGYQLVQVDEVEVEVGVGSPMPVFANISGRLPDTCAQIELIESALVGSEFTFKISTIPSNAEGCLQDSVPFLVRIPLNVVPLPDGPKNVNVKIIDIDTPPGETDLPVPETEIIKDDIQVVDVNIQVGVDSPASVQAVISPNLPNSCAQIGEIRHHFDGSTFFVRLIAYTPSGADCINDTLPFLLEFPLNTIDLSEGPYEVNVNGATASFDPRTVPVSE